MAEYIDKHKAYMMLKDLEAAYMQVAVKEAYGTAALRIDQMKAADVQSVKRGHWIKETFDYSRCSICGEIRKPSNFCPECGADMRQEESNGKTN